MLLEQIPEFLKTMQSLFVTEEAVTLTSRQFELMKEAMRETTKQDDAKQDQARLYGILGRIGRRMRKTDSNHFYATEYQYIANSMMTTLKENDACRLDDTLADINEIFSRSQRNLINNNVSTEQSTFTDNKIASHKKVSNDNATSNNKRHTDKRQIVSIFG